MIYYTRDQWGSTQHDRPGHPVNGAVRVVIAHHSFRPHVEATASIETEMRVVRGIQRYHVEDQGWDDIGYQFLVFQSGRGYEGRGWFRTGAHTHGRNSKSVGLCFVINGDLHVPTKAAWSTARAIIDEGVRFRAISPNPTISGHTDYAAKSCPGDRTYPLIDTRLTAKEIWMPNKGLIYTAHRTPDALAVEAALHMAHQGQVAGWATTHDPREAKRAVRAGEKVYEVGGTSDVNGAITVRGENGLATFDLVATLIETG